MSWIEHPPTPAPTAAFGTAPSSTVTLAARRYERRLELLLTVYRPVQELLPWLRGGGTVSVVLGERQDAGLMRIGRDGPHRLLGRGGTLDKLPPVLLRIERLPWMTGDQEQAETAVSYETREQGRCLQLRLPAWAAPPPVPSGTLTAYAGLFQGARP